MLEEATTKSPRFFISEDDIKTSSINNLERLAKFIGCLPEWPRQSSKNPEKVSRRYRRTLIKNLITACCKKRESWERNIK